MTTAPVELLTVPEVMTRLKYGRSKVYDLIRSKRLASFTEGRCRRIPESALQDYIRTRLEEAA
ncbi:helix-turn-helix domain-containing protein [Streptomyces sp. SID13726]|uniref:helix-turn-helix domain-containing protein n=1 Tax=Streptomyces sp. SID13726 TaxID=2706058 RepID=UPI0013BE8285|nr:helix-turn-helix domain-containing protein [Streptomyces sp. SID13726]NEB06118.1 helix-turn-helix domain-containing protein [Streptomyces sp. SID13726]